MDVLAAGLMMGIASGLHCLGMCGPLVAAFPPANTNIPLILDPWHLARILTYGVLGIVTGVIGNLVSFAGLHIFAGFVILLLIGVGLAFWWRNNLHFNFMSTSLMKNLWAKSVNTGGIKGRLALGALNGMLPCGMVYFALATSLAWGGISDSVTFMLAFGLGTLPFLLSITFFGRMIPSVWKRKFKVLQPLLLLLSLSIVFWRVVVIPMGWQVFLPWIDEIPMCTSSVI